jgi:hypothetical protein
MILFCRLATEVTLPERLEMACNSKAVFEVGDTNKTVDVEFDTIMELREAEDDLTWEHWPDEVNCVSIDFKPIVEEAVVEKAVQQIEQSHP